MLSPDVRRRDKDFLSPDRVAKLFLSDDMVSLARGRGYDVRVWKGRFYVAITDFKSTGWLKHESKTYRNLVAFAVIKFCTWRRSFPDDLIELYKGDREALISDIRGFVAYLMDEGYSNSYVSNLITGIVGWLNVNGIDISRSELRTRRIRLPSGKGYIQDMPPTRSELRLILSSIKVNWRAVIHFLSATGMRPSEALVLRICDVKPHPIDAADLGEVIEVHVPGTITKRKVEYTTFCHPEAAQSLAQYLKHLENRGYDVYDEKLPLFYNPRSSSGFYRINSLEVAWNRIVDRLGLDERITYVHRRIRMRHLYTLRKFFRTNLEAAGVPYGAVEALLGHKQWYVRFSRERLRRYYEKGMWALMVFRTVTEERIKEILEAELGKIRSEIEALKMEREKYLISKEREVRDLVEKLYRILRRHPEILKELEET